MRTNRRNIKLAEYVERRTGVPLGARGSLTNMLHRSLGSETFAGFWLYWNPIWGYYLGRYVNAPMRRFLPPAAALIITFLVSGVIHDTVITAVRGSLTVLFVPWFLLLGLIVVVSSSAGIRCGSRMWAVRALVNVSLVVAGLGVAMAGQRLLGIG
jgi:hypothetical protein